MAEDKDLYVVDYQWIDTDDNIIEKDRWFFGCESHFELERIMELNKRQFESYGFKIIGYTYQIVTLASENQQIIIKQLWGDSVKFRIEYVRTVYETYEVEVDAESEEEAQDSIINAKYNEEIEGEVFIDSYSDDIEVTGIDEMSDLW